MAEYYNMILDEDELHWFFDHIIQKPLEYETYMIMLACRGKKLTDEEREYTKVGSRGEMMREELIWISKRNVELPKFLKKSILHFIAQEKSFLGLGTLQYDFGSREIWRNKSTVVSGNHEIFS